MRDRRIVTPHDDTARPWAALTQWRTPEIIRRQGWWHDACFTVGREGMGGSVVKRSGQRNPENVRCRRKRERGIFLSRRPQASRSGRG
jgi:hypothetical protein